MPFVSADEKLDLSSLDDATARFVMTHIRDPDAMASSTAPSFGETLGASAQKFSWMYGMATRIPTEAYSRDSTYDGLNDPLNQPYVEMYGDLFGEARNAAHSSALRRQIHREERANEILDRSGGLSSLAAFGIVGLLSPETFIPVGGAFRAARGIRALSAAERTGRALSVARVAVQQAAAKGKVITREQLQKALVRPPSFFGRAGEVTTEAALAESAAEAVLQAQQITRTAGESVENVAAAAIFGSVLGGLGSTVVGARGVYVKKLIELENRLAKFDEEFVAHAKAKGLTPADLTDDDKTVRLVQDLLVKDDEGLALMVGMSPPSKGGFRSYGERFFWTLMRVSPNVKGAISSSPTMRIATHRLTQTGFLRKNLPEEATRPSVQAQIHLFNNNSLRNFARMHEQYVDYVKLHHESGIATRRMTKEQYLQAITKGARRQIHQVETRLHGVDFDSTPSAFSGLSPLDDAGRTAITRGARLLREVLDEVRGLAQATGHTTLSDFYENSVINTALSWVPRRYNVDKVISEQVVFKKLIAAFIRSQGEVPTPEKLDDIVQKIRGTYSEVGLARASQDPLRERTLMIRDDFRAMIDGVEVAFEDYLENDPGRLINWMARSLVPQMYISKAFAGPAMARANEMLGRWERTYENIFFKAGDRTPDEIREAMQEMELLRLAPNDTHVLEILHGRFDREADRIASQYEIHADNRDVLIRQRHERVKELRAAVAEVRSLKDYIAKQKAMEEEAGNELALLMTRFEASKKKIEREITKKLQDAQDLKDKAAFAKTGAPPAPLPKVKFTISDDEFVDLWYRALSGKRDHSKTEPLYWIMRRAVLKAKPGTDLHRLAQEFKGARGLGEKEAEAALKVARKAARQGVRDLKQHDVMIDTTKAYLVSLRQEVRRRAWDNDDEIAIFDPAPMNLKPTASRLSGADPKEQFAYVSKDAFEKIASERSRHSGKTENGKRWRDKIERDFNKETAKHPPGSVAAKAVQRKLNDTLRTFDHIVADLAGKAGINQDPTGLGFRTSRLMRQLSFVSKMGGVTISSIPDMAMAISTVGFVPWAKSMLAMLRNPVKALSNIKARDDLAYGIIAAEMIQGITKNSRMGDIFDLNPVSGTFVEKSVDWMADKMGSLSLINRWNALNKAYASVAIQQRASALMEKLATGTALTRAEQNLANIMRLNRPMSERALAQIQKHGDTEKAYGVTIRHANTKAWDDRVARDWYEAVILDQVHRTVITPGAGELPRWASENALMKMFIQFKSFGISATQNILVAGLQRGATAFDLSLYLGLTGLFAMGLLTEVLKRTLNGQDIDWENESELTINAIDRSGLIGHFADVNAIAERITAGKLGLSTIAGTKGVTRYSARNVMDVLLGPGYGYAQSVAQAAHSATKLVEGKITDQDVRNARRMLPYQNLFYIRGLFDMGLSAIRGEEFTPIEQRLFGVVKPLQSDYERWLNGTIAAEEGP